MKGGMPDFGKGGGSFGGLASQSFGRKLRQRGSGGKGDVLSSVCNTAVLFLLAMPALLAFDDPTSTTTTTAKITTTTFFEAFREKCH